MQVTHPAHNTNNLIFMYDTNYKQKSFFEMALERHKEGNFYRRFAFAPESFLLIEQQ